jgi:single-strand DNA-binding protein
MRTVNKVTLLGYLGKDPVMRDANGISVANFTLATNERWKDKSGEYKEATDWHNITLWGKQAENAHKFLAKGSLVYLEGKMKTRQYTDKEGVEKYITEVVVGDILFISGAPSKSSSEYEKSDPFQ